MRPTMKAALDQFNTNDDFFDLTMKTVSWERHFGYSGGEIWRWTEAWSLSFGTFEKTQDEVWTVSFYVGNNRPEIILGKKGKAILEAGRAGILETENLPPKNWFFFTSQSIL